VLLVVAAVLYFGVNIGEVYWRFYEYEDAMRQEVRFAAQIPDERMKLHLSALADSLGLPEEAGDVTIDRTKTDISVSAEYSEQVEFPLFVRQIRFKPHAEGRL
jgi:hypothetical protein